MSAFGLSTDELKALKQYCELKATQNAETMQIGPRVLLNIIEDLEAYRDRVHELADWATQKEMEDD